MTNLYSIETSDPSPQFLAMWQAAGLHIQSFFQDGLQSWLKVEPQPPFLEHLSFRLGNQVFFIRLEDVDGKAEVPGNRQGVCLIAEGWNGVPCLMQLRSSGGNWKIVSSGWGLVDLRDGSEVDPTWLVSDEHVEATDWELLDFGVQVVKQWLKDQGYTLMSSHSNPEVHPNIWFVSERGPEWVIVRVARYPEKSGDFPANWRQVSEDCAHLSRQGHFAPVSISSSEQPGKPIWRGHAAEIQFDALIPLNGNNEQAD